jgi:hypothetical protein
VYEINTYSIDTTVTNGTITPDESGIQYGSDRTITYSPNTGYHLVSVTVDGSPVSIVTYASSYTFNDILDDHTIDVVYAINTYSIDTTVTNGTITPDESGIQYGSDRTITYSANTGYHLVSVTVDGSPVDIGTYPGSYAFDDIAANHTIEVVYEINTYSIDTTATNGTITPDESGIPYGEDRTITYSPNVGYHLVSVTVDGSPVDIGTYPSSYTFSNITANHTIEVVYEINTYSIDTTATNGTITPDESGIPYGEDRTITYSSNVGYHLVSVTVDGSPVDIGTYPGSYAFDDIAANHTIEVVYEINTYSIDTTVTNGTITPDESGIQYGESRTVTYAPNLGYSLVSVTVDGVPVSIATYPNSYTFSDIAANHTIEVVYTVNTYSIGTAVTNGTITPDRFNIPYGATRTITYSPNEGYDLVSVTVDGTPVSIVAFPDSYTFFSVRANHSIAVVYEAGTPPTPTPTATPVIITDPDVPLGGPPTWALVNLILMIGTALASIGLIVGYSKRRGKGMPRAFSVIPAVGAIIAFILTEDMRNPMIMVDKWTILMAAIAVVQLVVMYFSRKSAEEADSNRA